MGQYFNLEFKNVFLSMTMIQQQEILLLLGTTINAVETL